MTKKCSHFPFTKKIRCKINIIILPIIIRFTVSSNMKSKVVVPQGLQFHVDEGNGKDTQETNGIQVDVISGIVSNSANSTGTIISISIP